MENTCKMRTVPLVPLQRGDLDQYSPETNQPPENPLKPRYSRDSIKTMLAADDRPNPIALCPACRSRNLSQETHFFWLWKRWRFVCKECSTTFQQVGDKYRLTQVSDTGGPIWRKYGLKTLYSCEWANIANGGSSDDEIIANLAKRPAAADR
jgi:hypothetical protein